MTTLKIKLCDLNRSDVGSIKSMFHLTAAQHKQDWEIVSSGDADLCIYSFESEKSIATWQKHGYLDGLTVLFSTNEDVDVAMDIVLKKPLRTKNFTGVLNKAAKQIKQASTLDNTSADDSKPALSANIDDQIIIEDIYNKQRSRTHIVPNKS